MTNLKFKHKILVMPFVAGIAFCVIVSLLYVLGSSNADLLDRIERGYAPALELSRSLEATLDRMQRSMRV